MSRIEVLLSTHDGERYLDELLDSLLGQDHPDFTVRVRDDGSRDATLELLRARAHDPRLSVAAASNVGVPWSYFELLEQADRGAELWAFCDQDDVWLPRKLRRADEELGRLDARIPAMYCGRQRLVGPALEPLAPSRLPERGPSFANALVENIATGCTVVLNRAARQRILAGGRPASAVMHDWWAYLVTSAFGSVVFDREPLVLYRQHGGNVIGSRATRWGRFGARAGRFVRRRARRVLTEQAREFARLHGASLAAEPRRILDRFLDRRQSVGGSLRYAAHPDVYRQSAFDDWVLRALLLFDRV